MRVPEPSRDASADLGGLASSFQLGEEWPDWWTDLVTSGFVTTHNHDGRWRGGPDYALIGGSLRANKGDWIGRDVNGRIWVAGEG